MMKTLFVSSLPENEGHSEQFLQDVLRLLSVHTAKSALELRFRADPASGSTFMADLPSAGLPLVSRFFGAHRAQIVPNDSPTGRIITVRVMVACIDHGASSRSPDEATGAAFTYSYPLGVVTAHGAGRQYPLGEFLEGRVGQQVDSIVGRIYRYVGPKDLLKLAASDVARCEPAGVPELVGWLQEQGLQSAARASRGGSAPSSHSA